MVSIPRKKSSKDLHYRNRKVQEMTEKRREKKGESRYVKNRKEYELLKLKKNCNKTRKE